MKALAGVNLSRMSTPRNWTLPWVARATLASSGASAVHGPHHEAHTFTTTGFPWSWATSRRNVARSKVGSWSGRDGSSRPFASAGVSESPPVHPDVTSERTIPRARRVTAERRGGMSPHCPSDQPFGGTAGRRCYPAVDGRFPGRHHPPAVDGPVRRGAQAAPRGDRFPERVPRPRRRHGDEHAPDPGGSRLGAGLPGRADRSSNARRGHLEGIAHGRAGELRGDPVAGAAGTER